MLNFQLQVFNLSGQSFFFLSLSFIFFPFCLSLFIHFFWRFINSLSNYSINQFINHFICLFIYLFIYFSFRLFSSLSIYLFIHLCIYYFFYIFINLITYSSIHSSVFFSWICSKFSPFENRKKYVSLLVSSFFFLFFLCQNRTQDNIVKGKRNQLASVFGEKYNATVKLLWPRTFLKNLSLQFSFIYLIYFLSLSSLPIPFPPSLL